ncbi:TatD family deoxyribonuclease [Bacillus taeanensis]|uniref:TatD family deoxyribonuclease n=1 Tax=Bacillus taeanensis TaxID=273032 RepID=A0A366XVP0_9BACI|nr:TatD family deoxyribonuclease [Bacillus taeanensis]
MIDAHIHLDQYNREDLPAYIEKWKKAGIKGAVSVSTNLRSSYDTLELANQFPDFVIPCIGFHPEQPLPAECELNELLTLIRSERHTISAIGEIGLPHYSYENSKFPSLQHYIELLKIFIEKAKQLSLPVVLHAVHDKAAIVYELLQKYEGVNAHFHWLKAEKKLLQLIIEAGYFISVTPEICYRERDRQLVSQVPLSQLMLETDGPWPYHEIFENTKTTPLLLKEVVQKTAEIKKISSKNVKDLTTKNTAHFYRYDRV